MISYVNTVFVANDAVTLNTKAAALKDYESAAKAEEVKGFVVDETEENPDIIRIGFFQGKALKVHGKDKAYRPVVKWSNWINKNYIKSANYIAASKYALSEGETNEDRITIDFTGCDANDPNEFARGNRRIVVRLTFKDMPTRFRKWTESYEYVTKPGDTSAEIATAFAKIINDQYKRARVEADGTTTAGKLVLTAMPYDDDNSVDTINVANKVRFNANVYYTNPQAAGFASKNKYFPTGLTINKKEGYNDPMSAKNVRDREAQAMGYEGILNRGCCTWPIIKPAMTTDLSKKYDGITIEFETKYRAADDIQRHTKQSIEIYVAAAETPAVGDIDNITTKIFAEDKSGVILEEIAYKGE